MVLPILRTFLAMVLPRWVLVYSWQPWNEWELSVTLLSHGVRGAELQFLDSEKRRKSLRHFQLEA